MTTQQHQQQVTLPGWMNRREDGAVNIQFARSPARKRAVQQRFEDEAHALVRAIESEIIPRLMLNHRLDTSGTAAHHARTVHAPEHAVEEIARLALDESTHVGMAYLDALQAKGVGIEAIYMDVVAPAARLIGQMWVDDARNFADVTIALARLQSLVNELVPRFASEDETRTSARSILLMPCPGEQHTLGLSMVTEYFRRAGWHVHPELPDSVAGLQRMVKAHRFDVVGFSASCERFIDDMTAAIRMVRKSSKNRSVGILVGGDLFNRRPELVSVVGADATAADGRSAIRRIPALLGLAAIIG